MFIFFKFMQFLFGFIVSYKFVFNDFVKNISRQSENENCNFIINSNGILRDSRICIDFFYQSSNYCRIFVEFFIITSNVTSYKSIWLGLFAASYLRNLSASALIDWLILFLNFQAMSLVKSKALSILLRCVALLRSSKIKPELQCCLNLQNQMC